MGSGSCSRPSSRLALLLMMLSNSPNSYGYPSQEGIIPRGLKDVNATTTIPPGMMKEVQGNTTNDQFIIRFSTWPPNLDFSNLNERAMRSLHSIFCQAEIQGDSQCILRNESVKTESMEHVETEIEAEDTQLFMAVKDFEESYHSTSSLPTETLSWTEWSISFLVNRLGSFIVHTVVVNDMVNTTETPLTAQSIYDAGVEFLGDQLSEEFKKNILSGNFDRLMNERSSMGSRVVTSIPGMEAETFYRLQYPLGAPPSSQIGPEAEENQPGIYIALFFAGLGVGFIVVLAMLIVACRTKRNDDQESADKNGQTERDESQSNHDAPIFCTSGRDTILVVETSQILDDGIRRGLRRTKSNDSRGSLGGDSYPGVGSVVSELSFAGSAVATGSVAASAVAMGSAAGSAVTAGSAATSAISGLSDSVVGKLDYETRSMPDQEDASWA